jgi:heme/copper-type cytochrome/quinol oxidase subunit 2
VTIPRMLPQFGGRLMRPRIIPIVIAVCAALTACGNAYGPGGGNPPPPLEIDATPSLAFNPPTLTVNVGEVVTFKFGSVAHNVFFDPQTGAPADIPGNNSSVSVTRTFTTAGTYRFTCHIHPSMVGTVTVQAP